MSLEDTQKLIDGATVIGAGRTLGLTDDETLETKRATLRRKIDQRRKERKEREGNRGAAEQLLADMDAKFQSKGRIRRADGKVNGIRTDEDFPDPFGSWEERIYSTREGEEDRYIETRRAEEDFQTYTPDEAEMFGIKAPATGADREVDPGLLQERGNYVTLNAGKPNEARFWREGRKVTETGKRSAATRADRPAKPRLFMKPENAASSRRPDFALGSQRNIPIAPNPNSADEAIQESRRAREASKLTVENDRGRFSPAMRAENDEAAFHQSQTIARNRFGLGGKGALADENIGYIQEVRSLGTAGPAGHGFTGNYQVVTPNNANNFGVASPLTRGNQVLGYYGDVDGEMVELGEINTPGTKNALNVPEFTPGQEWVGANRPNMGSPGGMSFGMPQVNIKQEIGQFGDRMRAMGMGMEGFGNPRSIPEFEAAIKSVLARGQAAGKTFYRLDADTGKPVVVQDPGIDDVLYQMRYTANEKQALANALLQMDTALTRNVNQDRKQAFTDRRQQTLSEQPIFTGVEPEGATTPLEKIKNEKVGRGKKRESVGAALRQLNEQAVIDALEAKGQLTSETGTILPSAARQIAAAAEGREEAKRPFVAAVAGEGVPRAQFIRGQDRGKSLQQLQSQFGEEQGRIAYEVEQRYLRDEAAKASRPTIDLTAERIRASDRQGRFEAAKTAYEMELIELQEIERLMTRGAQQPGDFDLGTVMGGRPRVIPAAPAGRKLEVPAEESFPGGRKRIVFDEDEKVARHLQITDPTPKTPGSWMGGPGAGSTISAWDKNPNPVQTQPIQKATFTASIAPDPWAETAPLQSKPAINSGQTAQPTKPQLALPESASVNARARISREIQRRGPQQTDSSQFYMDLPDGPSSDASNREAQLKEETIRKIKSTGQKIGERVKDYATNDKYKTQRRIGYGGAALATILGLSNMGKDDKEEERYYG